MEGSRDMEGPVCVLVGTPFRRGLVGKRLYVGWGVISNVTGTDGEGGEEDDDVDVDNDEEEAEDERAEEE